MKALLNFTKGLFTTIFIAGLLTFSGCQKENLPSSTDEGASQITTELQTKGSGPSANGQGTITLASGSTRHFSFHAKIKNNGDVQGSGVLTYTAGELKVHFDIECLAITGNTAIMTGIITNYPQFPERVGWECWFKAVDNGEGSNADADELTLMLSNPDLEDCDFDYLVALNVVEGGNIQIKP
ncbi:hypothetical protein [Ulvibacter antarcticus]|nr:hypothetical protein [Ulvibacter antarcticus]